MFRQRNPDGTTAVQQKTTEAELRTAVEDAEKLAKQAHRGQVDLAGTTYWYHIRRVARACERHGPAAEAAAWLHDTVEDTRVTIAELEEAFPKEVWQAVQALTRRPGQTYRDYIEEMSDTKNRIAILVKLADLCDHAKHTPSAMTPGLARRYDMAYSRLVQRATAHRIRIPVDERRSPFVERVEADEKAKSDTVMTGRAPETPRTARKMLPGRKHPKASAPKTGKTERTPPSAPAAARPPGPEKAPAAAQTAQQRAARMAERATTKRDREPRSGKPRKPTPTRARADALRAANDRSPGRSKHESADAAGAPTGAPSVADATPAEAATAPRPTPEPRR